MLEKMKNVITSSLKSSKIRYDRHKYKTDPEYKENILYMVLIKDQSNYL